MTCSYVKMVNSLYKVGGEGSPSNPVKFNGQDYAKLKASLLRQGRKFEDDTFPADFDSLGKLEGFSQEKLDEVEWLRPKELNSDASFLVDGASRFDFTQGEVGNCWFLCSIGALTLCQSLLAKVVPQDQSFKDNYAGIFHFKFWRYGKWVDVVIDDLLPTRNQRPVSVHSKSEKEFWAPLLEKAYAKICGSYEDMNAGNPPEAFKDFCGGVHMNYSLSKPPPDLWDVMTRAVEYKTMMGCGTFGGDKGTEIEKKFNLVEGHAFAVTGVRQVESEGNSVNLVRIWNPWGKKEWNGDWSDKSALWNTVSDEDREDCLKVCDDGDFWIKEKDFYSYFEELDICCDSPNFIDDDDCQWNCLLKEGRWKGSDTEGDCKTKPQYRLTVKAVEGEDKDDKNVLLSLMQKSDEEHRSKINYLGIGFDIYKVPPKAPKGQLDYLAFPDGPLKYGTLNLSREVIEFHNLKPGEYLIVPDKTESKKTTDFIITIYSKAEAEME